MYPVTFHCQPWPADAGSPESQPDPGHTFAVWDNAGIHWDYCYYHYYYIYIGFGSMADREHEEHEEHEEEEEEEAETQKEKEEEKDEEEESMGPCKTDGERPYDQNADRIGPTSLI